MSLPAPRTITTRRPLKPGWARWNGRPIPARQRRPAPGPAVVVFTATCPHHNFASYSRLICARCFATGADLEHRLSQQREDNPIRPQPVVTAEEIAFRADLQRRHKAARKARKGAS